jgi:hypothetical protein
MKAVASLSNLPPAGGAPVQQPVPGYGAPPGYGASGGQPAPGYGYGAPAQTLPGYGAPPGYVVSGGQPAPPGYGQQPAPGYGAAPPGYGASGQPAPSYAYGAPAQMPPQVMRRNLFERGNLPIEYFGGCFDLCFYSADFGDLLLHFLKSDCRLRMVPA